MPRPPSKRRPRRGRVLPVPLVTLPLVPVGFTACSGVTEAELSAASLPSGEVAAPMTVLEVSTDYWLCPQWRYRLDLTEVLTGPLKRAAREGTLRIEGILEVHEYWVTAVAVAEVRFSVEGGSPPPRMGRGTTAAWTCASVIDALIAAADQALSSVDPENGL